VLLAVRGEIGREEQDLRIESVEREYMKGPKPWVYMTFGQAVNPG